MAQIQNVKLADCCKIISGSTPKTGVAEYWDGDILWATPKDISLLNAKYISTTTKSITQKGYSSCSTQIIPAFSVLLSSRAPIGLVAINSVEMCTNQGFKNLVPDKTKLTAEYLYYWLKTKKDYLQSLGNGATFKEISKTTLSRVEIPLLSIEDQQRVVKILDEADSLIKKRKESEKLLDEYAVSVFNKMFGDISTNPNQYEVKTISELASDEKNSIKAGPFGSSLKKEIYVKTGYKVYGQEQVIRNDLRYGDYYIDEKKYRSLESCKINSGDVLISLVGTFGKISVVPDDFEPGIINPRLMKITPNKAIIFPLFLKELLVSDIVQKQIKSMSHGGTMDIVNVGIMKKLAVLVPSLEEQRNFLDFKEKIESMKLSMRNQLQLLEEQLQSLLQKAFRGNL